MTSISSLQNTRIKQIIKLRNRRNRNKENLTIVEGVREIRQALNNNLLPSAAFVCPKLISEKDNVDIVSRLATLETCGSTIVYEITPEVYAKIAYRGESGGILLLLPYWPCLLNNLPIKEKALFAIVENAEKPGNVGAILRTAEAAGVDGVVICSSEDVASSDIFNPNVIRASLGTVFSLPVAVATTDETIQWLRNHQIQIIATMPDAEMRYTAVNMIQSTAIITGSEAFGLSKSWSTHADQTVTIPMQGSINSLNLSVSTALLVYEAIRQRGTL